MNILELPFNRHLGLQLTRYQGRPVVSLEPQEHHRNHLGTVHAGALYALAEAASGHALLSETDSEPDTTIAALRSARVKYRRAADQQLVALASFNVGDVSTLAQSLETKGRAFIDVHVRILAGGHEVFAGDFTWFVTRPKSESSA